MLQKYSKKEKKTIDTFTEFSSNNCTICTALSKSENDHFWIVMKYHFLQTILIKTKENRFIRQNSRSFYRDIHIAFI